MKLEVTGDTKKVWSLVFLKKEDVSSDRPKAERDLRCLDLLYNSLVYVKKQYDKHLFPIDLPLLEEMIATLSPENRP